MGRTYTIHVAVEPFKVFSVKNAPSLRSNQFFGNNSTERKCNKVLQNGCAYVALDEMCSVRCPNVCRLVQAATDDKRETMHLPQQNLQQSEK